VRPRFPSSHAPKTASRESLYSCSRGSDSHTPRLIDVQRMFMLSLHSSEAAAVAALPETEPLRMVFASQDLGFNLRMVFASQDLGILPYETVATATAVGALGSGSARYPSVLLPLRRLLPSVAFLGGDLGYQSTLAHTPR